MQARREASLTVTGSDRRKDTGRLAIGESTAPLPAHLQAVVLEWVEGCKKEMVLDALPIPLGIPED